MTMNKNVNVVFFFLFSTLFNFRDTVEICRQLEATGISFLTVHGRTIKERGEPVHLDYIKAIVDALNVPVIANGDIDSLEKAHIVQEETGCQGGLQFAVTHFSL